MLLLRGLDVWQIDCLNEKKIHLWTVLDSYPKAELPPMSHWMYLLHYAKVRKPLGLILFAVKIIGVEENFSREFSAEESAALSGNKQIPDLDKKRADIWLMQLRVQFPSRQPPYGSIKNITYAKEGVKIAGGKGNPRHIRQARSPFGSILFRIRGFQKSRIRTRSRRDRKQTAR